MKRTLAATLIAGLFTSYTVDAIEIYKDETNSVTVGGFIDARIINTQGQTEVVNGASRINFDFKRQLQNGWHAFVG